MLNRILAALLILAVAFASARTAAACTTVLVGSDLTGDTSVLHAHNEDMGNDAAGRLWWTPGRSHAEEATVRVPYVELPQATATFR